MCSAESEQGLDRGRHRLPEPKTCPSAWTNGFSEDTEEAEGVCKIEASGCMLENLSSLHMFPKIQVLRIV